MITGFNHNLKYKGAVFHVQTEDSGIKNPHIITHLFIGGNIIATKKISYANIVNKENMEAVVKGIMEEQHKEMINKLLKGAYDSHPLIQKAVGDSAPAEAKPAAKPAPDLLQDQPGDVVSGKSLDEIILDYLTDDVKK